MTPTLCSLAADILNTADPETKVARTATAVKAWRRGDLDIGRAPAPDRPARPAKPELLPPRDMPRRSTGPKGLIALVHALAHIELNAVDLAWDIILRFASGDLPRAFYDDWVGVADEEAEHYAALAARLIELGATYGDLPAHDGLWGAATRTADDLAARLALIPMTLEARGLDTTPETTRKLRQTGDETTSAILDLIYTDEIKHLAVGVRWFEYLCAARGDAPHTRYSGLINERFPGGLKAPFNMEAREQAGMGEAYLKSWM
ncbi:MAG: ferritin-like domain-containing protein [Rhodospirillaceae bacterium]|nr:ferritin-like domain-containing protein [Rhodospirillaceae bacterium]